MIRPPLMDGGLAGDAYCRHWIQAGTLRLDSGIGDAAADVHRRMDACQHAYYLEADATGAGISGRIPARDPSTWWDRGFRYARETIGRHHGARRHRAGEPFGRPPWLAACRRSCACRNGRGDGQAGDWYASIKRRHRALRALRREEARQRQDVHRHAAQGNEQGGQKAPRAARDLWMTVARRYGINGAEAGRRDRTLSVLKIVFAFLPPLAALGDRGKLAGKESYPEQTVRILVRVSAAWPPMSARASSRTSSPKLGQTVVVENVSGAGGNMRRPLAKAAPDGTTLGMVGNGTLVFQPETCTTGSPSIRSGIRADRAGVRGANVLVVPNEVRRRLCRSSSRSPAPSGQAHLRARRRRARRSISRRIVQIVGASRHPAVAYPARPRCCRPARRPRQPCRSATSVNMLPLVREGKCALSRDLAQAIGIAPDLPPWRVGYPGFEAVPWFGSWRLGTPPAIIDKAHRDTVKICDARHAEKILRSRPGRPSATRPRSSPLPSSSRPRNGRG